MSLTNVAMLGILMGFVFLVVGFLMEGPQVGTETAWNKTKRVPKKVKKTVAKIQLRKHAA